MKVVEERIFCAGGLPERRLAPPRWPGIAEGTAGLQAL